MLWANKVLSGLEGLGLIVNLVQATRPCRPYFKEAVILSPSGLLVIDGCHATGTYRRRTDIPRYLYRFPQKPNHCVSSADRQRHPILNDTLEPIVFSSSGASWHLLSCRSMKKRSILVAIWFHALFNAFSLSMLFITNLSDVIPYLTLQSFSFFLISVFVLSVATAGTNFAITPPRRRKSVPIHPLSALLALRQHFKMTPSTISVSRRRAHYSHHWF